MTVNVTAKAQVVETRDHVPDFSAAETAWPDLWIATFAAAEVSGNPVLVIGPSAHKMDLDASIAANRIAVPSGTRMRGNGSAVIRLYNGDTPSEDGSGFYADTSSEDLSDIFYEYLTFEGENGSDWGHAFSFVSNLDTMPIRFVSTDADNELRNYGVRFSTFRYLDAFPVQVIGTIGHAFGGFFDFNFCYRVNRAMNVSSPYSSISFNKFEESQLAEFAAPAMLILGNIGRKYYGNYSVGASGLTTASRFGNIIALSTLDEQIQTNASSVVGTTDGAESALIALNSLRRANSAAVLLGSAVTDYGAPRSRLLGNMILSAGNVAAGLSRIAIDVDQDYADVDLNTIYNDAGDAGVWETQTGMRIKADYGAYDRNRLDGTANHVQFNGCIGVYWGAGNIYDVAKIAFSNPPSGASYFLDGSYLRGRNIAPGTTSLPTPSINYRGLTHSTQSDSTGYGDTQYKIIRGPNGTYVANPIGAPVGKAVSAALTAKIHDRLLLVTTGASNRLITLPTGAAIEGYTVTVKKVDAGVGEVQFSENVDGAALTLPAQYDYVTIYYDGSVYYKIGGN